MSFFIFVILLFVVCGIILIKTLYSIFKHQIDYAWLIISKSISNSAVFILAVVLLDIISSFIGSLFGAEFFSIPSGPLSFIGIGIVVITVNLVTESKKKAKSK